MTRVSEAVCAATRDSGEVAVTSYIHSGGEGRGLNPQTVGVGGGREGARELDVGVRRASVAD